MISGQLEQLIEVLRAKERRCSNGTVVLRGNDVMLIVESMNQHPD